MWRNSGNSCIWPYVSHICLYHKRSKNLISGVALNVVDGALTGPVPQYTHDLAQAIESFKKLAQHEIRTLISYHGGVFSAGPNRRIAKIANGKR